MKKNIWLTLLCLSVAASSQNVMGMDEYKKIEDQSDQNYLEAKNCSASTNSDDRNSKVSTLEKLI